MNKFRYLHITACLSPSVTAVHTPTCHLVCQHDNSLDREFATAKVEQVLQAWPQKVNHHDIVLALNTIPPQVRDTSCDKQYRLDVAQGNLGGFAPPPCKIL